VAKSTPTNTPKGYHEERIESEGSAMTDPVCGMTVSQDTAAAAWEHGGETYYFCSVGCFERFKGEPDRFLAQDPADRHM
jgi:YHS domain-containing protein